MPKPLKEKIIFCANADFKAMIERLMSAHNDHTMSAAIRRAIIFADNKLEKGGITKCQSE